MNTLTKAAAGAALAAGLGSLAYPLFFRRWCLTWARGPTRCRGSWIFALFAEDGKTRLISRNRIAATGPGPARLLSMLVMEPGSLVMERKMLLGIKQRAEDLACRRAEGQAAVP